jgi:hypothetical protein
LSADALRAYDYAIAIQKFDKRLIVSPSNIEEILVIHELRAAKNFENDTLLFRAELISGTKEQWNAGIDEIGGRFLGFHGVYRGIGEHQMEQPAHMTDRIINGNSQARSQRIGHKSRFEVVAYRQVSDADDDGLLKNGHGETHCCAFW